MNETNGDESKTERSRGGNLVVTLFEFLDPCMPEISDTLWTFQLHKPIYSLFRNLFSILCDKIIVTNTIYSHNSHG